MLLLESTRSQLTRAKTPEDRPWVDVPDSRLTPEQQSTLAAAKALFQVSESSTFCIGKNKNGERVIVQPKLVRDGQSVAIRWGKNSYRLNQTIDLFDMVNGSMVAVVADYVFPLNLADLKALPPSELTKTQKQFLPLNGETERIKFLKKLNLTQLAELLRTPGSVFTKLKDLPQGDYHVTAFEAVTGLYGTKYQLTLDDGRKVDGNTAVNRVCTQWDSYEVLVSAERPALLVVGGTYTTNSGKDVVTVQLYSHADQALEVFDFTDATAANDTPLTEDLDLVDRPEVPY